MPASTSAINYFASKINQGDLNTLSNTYYDYGSTPNFPVVEQNQTYFAYFDGVGGTGPEIIDQTAYSIKYLIDTNGNVVNPEPDTVDNRPQAIALYNLLNNFEVGTNAIVKLIESDPTLTENPNDDALVGKYPVTHVGRLVLLATSEYGISNTDFLATMSFQEYGTFIQGGDPPNFSFLAWQTGNITSNISPSTPFTPTTIDFTNIQSNELGYFDGTSNYIFGDNTFTYGLSVSFEAATNIKFNPVGYNAGSILTFSYWIEYSEDSGLTWNKLPIFIYGPSEIIGSGTNADYRNQGTIDESGTIYTTTWVTNGNLSSPDFYNTIRSNPRAFLINTQVRVRYLLNYSYDNNNSSTNVFFYLYGSPSTSGGTRFALINNTGYAYNVTSSYFDDISTPTTSLPFLPQSLTASLNFSTYINNDYVQMLPDNLIAFDYQQPTYPLNIQPGDFIRCEYNPDQVATIVEVTSVDETPSRTCLKIFPPIIPDGATLDHFTIYRIINDGSNIILNVPKPVRGNSFSGIIQPEFVTKELVDNYDKIIVDLTEREIIQ